MVDGVKVARELVAKRFPEARAAWLGGSVAPLTAEVDTILAPYGGRLFAGFHLAGAT